MAWIQQLLQSVALLMISPTVPGTDALWIGADAWRTEGPALVYSAESEGTQDPVPGEHVTISQRHARPC